MYRRMVAEDEDTEVDQKGAGALVSVLLTHNHILCTILLSRQRGGNLRAP